MRTAVRAALAAAMLTTSVLQTQAQDAPNPAWTGFYIGGAAGGLVDSSAHWDYTGIFGAVPQFGDDVSGGLYGAFLGYNHQLGRFVIGIEGDLAKGDINGSEPCENDANYNCSTDIDDVFTVRGRLGYAFDHLLIYGTGGWARADVSLNARGPFSFDARDEVDGYVVGGGADLMIGHNVSLGAEALYFNFDDAVAPWVANGCCGNGPIGQQNFEADFTVIRGRLTLHLN